MKADDIHSIFADFKRCKKGKMECYAEIGEKYGISEHTVRKNIEVYKNLESEKNILRNLHRNVDRFEKIEEYFQTFLDNLKNSVETIEVQKPKQTYICQDNTLYTAFADCHLGLTVEIERNRYNREVFEQRMSIYMSELIAIIERNEIKKVVIINLGDSIHNALQISALRSSDCILSDQVIIFARLMSKFLSKLSEKCVVEYIHISGNHDEIRLFGEKGFPDYFSKIITEYINLSTKNIKITLADGFYFEHGMFFTHKIKSNLLTAMSDAMLYTNSTVTMLVAGHMHQAKQQSAGSSEIIVVPSICGSDLYSKSLCKFSEAGAIAWINNCGKRWLTYSIRLQK